jgi:hypothetical protein
MSRKTSTCFWQQLSAVFCAVRCYGRTVAADIASLCDGYTTDDAGQAKDLASAGCNDVPEALRLDP